MNISWEDEGPIRVVPSTPYWSENFCFCLFDPGSGIGMWVHIGRWVHDPRIFHEIVSIALPGDRVIVAKSYGNRASPKVAAANFLAIEVCEPGKRFRLSYHGPAWERSRKELIEHGFRDGHSELLDFDVTVEGCAPLWDTSGHAGKSEEFVGSMHIEQIGKGHGTLGFKGERHQIKDAFVNRDHTRGVRVTTTYKRHSWIQGWFPSGRGFHAYTAEINGTEGYVMDAACVVKAGKLYPGKALRVDCPEVAGDLYKPFSLQVESELGKENIRVVKVFNSWPLAMSTPNDLGIARMLPPSGQYFEESVQYEWDGETGYGNSERGVISNLMPTRP